MTSLNEKWLSLFKDNYEIAEKFLVDPKIDTAVKTFGVDTSTIRAMPSGNDDISPLYDIFCEWAKTQDCSLGIESTGDTNTPRVEGASISVDALTQDFNNWHHGLAESLSKYWSDKMQDVEAGTRINKDNEEYQRKQTKELNTAHKYKLVDLYVRGLRLRVPHNSSIYNAVLENANIPLDKKSIAVIEAFLGNPPRKTTMGDIKDEETYRMYQDHAKDICEQVRLTSGKPASKLVLDAFAWHNPEAQKLYE
ncbi:conserved protein of unknown function [Burkholderia multivorans]